MLLSLDAHTSYLLLLLIAVGKYNTIHVKLEAEALTGTILIVTTNGIIIISLTRCIFVLETCEKATVSRMLKKLQTIKFSDLLMG